MIRKNVGDASVQGGGYDQECRRKCWNSVKKSQRQRCGGEEYRFGRKEEEDARLLDRCEAKGKEWSNHWQCDEEVQRMQDKPWKNEELSEGEEALPRLKEGDLEKASRLY